MSRRESIGANANIDPLGIVFKIFEIKPKKNVCYFCTHFNKGGIQLNPSNDLMFKGPFDDYVTVSLGIQNPTERRIAFKIKTTAPKRYCVKPNSGVLDKGDQTRVNGSLKNNVLPRRGKYCLLILHSLFYF